MAGPAASPPQRDRRRQRCGALDAESCACDHWCAIFGGHREIAGWRADCPRCKAGRALSWKVSDGRVQWWTFCSCPHDAVRLVLAERLPDCVPKTRRSPYTVARSELEKLVGLPAAALKLRIACLAWDMPPEAAAAKLGMPERTYRRAVTAAAKSGREPQVSISGGTAKSGQESEEPSRPKVAGNRRSQAPKANTGSSLTTAANLVPPEAAIRPPTKRACARHDNQWTCGEGHPHCLDCQALANGAGEVQGLAAVAFAEEAAAGSVAGLLQARARRQARTERARTDHTSGITHSRDYAATGTDG